MSGKELRYSLVFTGNADQAKAAAAEVQKALGGVSVAIKETADKAGKLPASSDGPLGDLPRKTQQYGDNVRVAGGHTANLVSQWNDIAVMMAAGQNPLQLALQQGTQVSQMLTQLGGGTSALRAVGASFLGMLNPVSMATIALIALGATGGQALMSLREETKTFDEEVEGLTTTLGRMRSNLDLLGNRRLNTVFGSLTEDVRELTKELVALDRGKQLRQLGDVAGSFLGEDVKESWGQLLLRNTIAGFASASGAIPSEAFTSAQSNMAANYADLGAANSFEDFKARTDEIQKLARSGDVQAVISGMNDLWKAMAGDNQGAEMSDRLRDMWREMFGAAREAARVEAELNGTARAEAVAAQVGQMVSGYAQQAELTRAIAQHGEASAEVEAVRAKHLREAHDARLAEMDVARESDEYARATAAFAERMAADTEARAATRQKQEAAVFADLERQAQVSQAILTFGENSAEVDGLRAKHAEDIFRAMLAQQGVAGTLLDRAAELFREEQARQQLIRANSAQDASGRMLQEMRDKRAIEQATLTYGERSVEVRELQIAAERRLYAASVANLTVSKERKAELMAQWELTNGMGAPDPFGTKAAETQAVASHEERINRLRLELQLVSATSVERARALAMHDAENAARKAGGDVEAWRARAAAVAEMTSALERQREAWDRATRAAEGMIDGPIDALMKGDVNGALKSLGQELVNLWSELALKNPLKNRLLGTNYATIDDIGGLGGFFGRLLGGQPLMPEAGRNAMAQSMQPATMSVTTPVVHISTSNLTGLPLATGLHPAANMPMAPVTGPSQAAAHLKTVAIQGATRADALTGLNAPFAGALSSMIAEAQSIFGTEAVKIHSAFRTVERQAELYAAAIQKHGSEAAARKWVAPPGKSQHNFGMAADLTYGNPEVRSWIHANAGRFGMGFPMGHEPWHIEPTGARSGTKVQQQSTDQLERMAQSAERATNQIGVMGARAETTGGVMQTIGGTLAGSLQAFGAQHGPLGMLGAGLLGGILRSIGLPGFDRGGWTGPGAPTDVAGVVHAGEYVFDAGTVQRLGVSNLEALRRGNLKGYRSGGLVTGGAPVVPDRGVSSAGQPASQELRHIFEMNVSGTGDAQIAAGVQAAISRAFDEFDRNVFAGRVRMVVNDKWGGN